MVADLLGDAFATGQLYGLFPAYCLDPIFPEIHPDLDASLSQAVVELAAIATLRSQVSNAQSRALYKAGPVEYQVEQGATVLTELLKSAEARFQRLLDQLVQGGRVSTLVYTMDAYALRSGLC